MLSLMLSLHLLAATPADTLPPLWSLDIPELQQGLRSGRFTVRQVVQASLDRIAAIDHAGPELRSVLTVNPDALAIADALDRELREGKPRGPLHGIPVLLKDNIDTRDRMPCTAGSRALKDSYPQKDSPVAARLRTAGAVILGKANLSEWANFRGEMSSSGWSALGGQTKNPYDTSRNPCGSSSGSGVAVSARLCPLAIGTETNGSIVCPSTANGVVGIKPTVGLVSRSGIIPISFTQDTPGPMARTVRDAAIGLGALTGIDPEDAKTLASQGRSYVDYTQFLDENALKGKRIGLCTEFRGTHYKVDELTARAIEDMKRLGAEIVEVPKVIAADGVGSASFTVMLCEYKDGLNRYFAALGSKAPLASLEELIAFNAKDPVELTYHDQRYLEMAQATGGLEDPNYHTALEKLERGSRAEGIDKVMDELRLDALLAPTGSPAWKTDWVNGDHYLLGTSSPAAWAGYPNVSVPMGFVDGLPVGLSLFGRAWSEPQLIAMAYAYEQATRHRKDPRIGE